METKKQTIEIDVPVGFEAVGHGRLSHGDYYIRYEDGIPSIWESTYKSSSSYVILKKVPSYRPITDNDILKALKGEAVKARFSHSGDQTIWKVGYLTGAERSASRLFYTNQDGHLYSFCEIVES